MTMKWYGDAGKMHVRGKTATRIKKAALTLARYIRRKVSRLQPTAGTGTKKRGLDPSKPGEYPKMVRKWLRRDIQWEFSLPAMTARVGTNSKYGKYLELGTRRIKRRPWLSKALFEMRTKIRSILRGR